jgi:hypothetical protein
MDDFAGPRPQEQGALEPPNRWPPTAIGTATPPPPPRRGAPRRARSVFRPAYVVASGLTLGGLATTLLAPWLTLRAMGWTVLAAGILFAVLLAWVHTGAAARVALWRRTRWIRRRQRALARAPRPSA